MISRLKIFLGVAALGGLCTCAAANAQLNYTTNWIGNSFGGNNTANNSMLHVPNYLQGMLMLAMFALCLSCKTAHSIYGQRALPDPTKNPV
jgi:hypothetical protein